MKAIKEFKELFLSDAHRYLQIDEYERLYRAGIIRCNIKSRKIPGLHFSFWMRLCAVLRGKRLWFPLYAIALYRYNHYQYKYGLSIPFNAQIGKGFYIGHFGCVVVNPAVVFGKNVNISQGVTIGGTNRGGKKGVPIIGEGVYIGPGAKIIGAIHVGNNVAIGANAVVTHDVPDNAVVGGVPAKIISMDGAEGYVNRKV